MIFAADRVGDDLEAVRERPVLFVLDPAEGVVAARLEAADEIGGGAGKRQDQESNADDNGPKDPRGRTVMLV